MHFYSLAYQDYPDDYSAMIMHEKKFTRIEFIQMYNEAILVDTENSNDIEEIMCEKFGFILVRKEIEIISGNGKFERFDENESDS